MISRSGNKVTHPVCIQGEIGEDGSFRVYRESTEELPTMLHFSPSVERVRKRAEKLVGHSLNHVLIEMHNGPIYFIDEHLNSDTTLDIVKGTRIVNISFGAEYTMYLQDKRSPTPPSLSTSNECKCGESSVSKSLGKGVLAKFRALYSGNLNQRTVQHIPMSHNSMFILGLESNKQWLHIAVPDRRDPATRSDVEKAFSDVRISLTFRHIGTFADATGAFICGQGATSKMKGQHAMKADWEQGEHMSQIFEKENQDRDFDWEGSYGRGFNVLPAGLDGPIVFMGASKLENKIVGVPTMTCNNWNSELT
jgi:hypothetical protein